MRDSGKLRTDILALVILASLSALFARLTWLRCWPLGDQGWYLQVAARVAAGEVLYQDIVWMYGPLPVHLLSTLFRSLPWAELSTFSLLLNALAGLACLLTYAAARFVLSPGWALLATVAVFFGNSRGGGFTSYSLSYTGAVPLGAALGLAFVFCLLAHARGGRDIWLIGAGIAASGAIMSKPEFALACVGTGLFFLAGKLWLARDRRRVASALLLFLLSVAITIAVGYRLLVRPAGWRKALEGYTGYDQTPLLFWGRPPWGSFYSWCYIVSGLGLHLLTAASLAGIALGQEARRRFRPLLVLAAFGVFLALAPWGVLHWRIPGLLDRTLSSLGAFARSVFQVVQAPGTLLLSALIFALGFRWLRARRQGLPFDGPEQAAGILAAYGALAAARFYLNPTANLLPHYWAAACPALVFGVLTIAPQALETCRAAEDGGPAPSRLRLALAALLVGYAIAGAILEARAMAWWDEELITPRGVALVPRGYGPEAETLAYIASQTSAEDEIFVVGFLPGFYFLSGRHNPSRHDIIVAGIRTSPADAQEIVERLRMCPPELIIIPRSIKEGETLADPSNGAAGKIHYENLRPVWDHIEAHYQVREALGTEPRIYLIYMPLSPP